MHNFLKRLGYKIGWVVSEVLDEGENGVGELHCLFDAFLLIHWPDCLQYF